MFLIFSHSPLLLKPHSFPSHKAVVHATATTTSERKSAKKKQQQKQGKNDGSGLIAAVSAVEKSLRLAFMEELMERARNRDAAGVSDVIYDMIAAGLSPGPRSFHGLVVAHSLNGDHEGAMQSLRRELSAGLRPLHETFMALIRLFGSKGHADRSLEILAAMERLNYDIRQAWIVLVDELVKKNYLEDANRVFLKGAKCGLRATDELYDLLIEKDCKAGDHSNAIEIAYEMEAAGRMATTFHFNCLLSVQANCGIPEIALSTFENMEYAGEDYMKPDTETYNWVFQAYTRAESYDRLEDVAELIGIMIEDHKRLQPNARTYALLVECFTKYCMVNEAIRHFRALRNFEGGTKVLHCEGNFGDPLSLYLRALCREGRIVELLEALEAMAKDNQPIPPRAMIMSRKYRTLVSSWIEPLQEEAEVGYEIDYIARYIAEGGLTGERKRWVPRRGMTPLDPDAAGFVYSSPVETSFKQTCLDNWMEHHQNLLATLQREGLAALGDASISGYLRVKKRLKKITRGLVRNVRKPKAASKMVVFELKEELEAQGLPTDGTRNVLYQRVQKARRINRSRNRPLWVPHLEAKEDKVGEGLDELISRIKLHEGDTEFWKRRFLGEGLNWDHDKPINTDKSEVLNDVDAEENVAKDVDDKEADEEEKVKVEVEQTESQDGDKVVEYSKAATKELTEMLGGLLLMDAEERASKYLQLIEFRKRKEADEDWFPMDIFEAFNEMRERRLFTVDDMYTVADAWGWTWEREIKNRTPQRWSQEWEVELAIKVMRKVIELGGTPTVGDCAMILHAAMRASMHSACLEILLTAHSLNYAFGGPLYDKVITFCLDLEELDAAIAIVADMETRGIAVPDQILDMVIAARQEVGNAMDKSSS